MALATLSVDLEARLASFERDFSKASRVAEDSARKIKGAYSDVGRTFEQLGATIASAIGVNFTVSLVKSAIDAQDKLKDLSKSTSLTVETLAGLSSVANKTGTDIDGIADSINKLSVNIGKDSAKFAQLGITAKDPIEAFKQLADVFNSIEDPQKRAAFAAEALGKSWKSAAPALSEGGKAIGEMIERGQKLAGITTETANRADDLNDSFTDLKGAVGGAATQFANSLVPSLTDTTKAMTRSIEEGNTLYALLRGFVGLGKLPFDALLGNGGIDNSTAGFRKDLESTLLQLEGQKKRVEANGGLLNTWLYGSGAELDQKILVTRNQLEALKKFGDKLNKPLAEQTPGNKPPSEKAVNDFLGSDKKAAKETAEASAEAIAYGKAMESLAKLTDDAAASQLDLTKSQKTLLELMSAPQWADMPETWKQTAIAQFESAHAAELAADQQKRLNELLGATDAAKIEEAAKDMELLAAALEKGTINAGQFIEAANARLSEGSDKIREQKSLVEELGLTFSSAFEDAIAGGKGFSAVLAGIAQDISKILVRKGITEPLGNAFMGLFEKNALGGVYSSPSLSAYSGGVYSSPQLFKFAHGAGVFGEAGPEAIMPLKRGPDGSLGVRAAGGGISVVINNNGTPQNVTGQREVVDSRGRRSLVLEMEDAMAAGVQRPGSRLNRALSAPRMISR